MTPVRLASPPTTWRLTLKSYPSAVVQWGGTDDSLLMSFSSSTAKIHVSDIARDNPNKLLIRRSPLMVLDWLAKRREAKLECQIAFLEKETSLDRFHWARLMASQASDDGYGMVIGEINAVRSAEEAGPAELTCCCAEQVASPQPHVFTHVLTQVDVTYSAFLWERTPVDLPSVRETEWRLNSELDLFDQCRAYKRGLYDGKVRDNPRHDILNRFKWVAYELWTMDELQARNGAEVVLLDDTLSVRIHPHRWDEHGPDPTILALDGKSLDATAADPLFSGALQRSMALSMTAAVRERIKTALDAVHQARIPIMPMNPSARFGAMLARGVAMGAGVNGFSNDGAYPVTVHTNYRQLHQDGLSEYTALAAKVIDANGLKHGITPDYCLGDFGLKIEETTVKEAQPLEYDAAVAALSSMETGWQFYPAQKDLVARVSLKPSALITADVGTGKTLMATALVQLLIQSGKARTALIVCPGATVRSPEHGNPAQWQAEIARYFPAMPVRRLAGPGESLTNTNSHGIWLTYYDEVRRLFQAAPSQLEGFDVVILDEAHTICNLGTQITQAILRIPSDRRYGFTATPMPNRVDDLFTLAGWLTWDARDPGQRADIRWPFDAKAKERFNERYGSTVRNPAAEEKALYRTGRLIRIFNPGVIISRAEELAWLLSGLVAGISKTDCRPDYRPAEIRVEYIPLTACQQEEYTAAGGEITQASATEPTSANRKLIAKLRSICALGSDGSSLKLHRSLELVTAAVSEGKQVLVVAARVSQSTGLAALLDHVGIPYARIDSTIPAKAHAAHADDFKSGQAPVLLMGQKCAAAHSFPRCQVLLLLSSEWSHGATHQAFGRIERLNSVADRVIHVLLHPGTIEETIWVRTRRKSEEAGKLLTNEGNVRGKPTISHR